MVLSCALDSDCDALNFCHNRVCVEIGLNDPCRLPSVSASLKLAHHVSHSTNTPTVTSQSTNYFASSLTNTTASASASGSLAGKNLLTPYQLDALASEIFRSPLCPSDLICSKALLRCIRPNGSPYQVIPPIVSPYAVNSNNGTAMAPQIPLTAYSMLADDIDGKRGVLCRRHSDCRVDSGCDKGRCAPLPRLNEKCMAGSLCRSPYVCSNSKICRYPCFGDLDCSQEGISIGVAGSGAQGEHFVCIQGGGYCDLEPSPVNILLIIAIIVPVVIALIVAGILFFIFKRKTKKLHNFIERVHFAENRNNAPVVSSRPRHHHPSKKNRSELDSPRKIQDCSSSQPAPSESTKT